MRDDDEFRFLAGDAARVGHEGALPEVDRTRLETPHGGVSALRFDPASPPSCIALHGAGLNAHSFDPLLLALGRPAAAIDLPGHGRSGWRDDADYRPETIAPALGYAATELARGGSPVLIGHSLGGLAAAHLAAAHPGLVAGLVFVDITPGLSPKGGGDSIREFITGVRSYRSVEEIIDRAIEFGIGSDRAALARGIALNTRVRSDGRIEWAHHFAHLDALPGGEDQGQEPYASAWTALEAVSAARIPVSLVRASQGLVDERLEEEWRKRLPGSATVTVDGPHNLHEAAPAALAAAVRELSAQH